LEDRIFGTGIVVHIDKYKNQAFLDGSEGSTKGELEGLAQVVVRWVESDPVPGGQYCAKKGGIIPADPTCSAFTEHRTPSSQTHTHETPPGKVGSSQKTNSGIGLPSGKDTQRWHHQSKVSFEAFEALNARVGELQQGLSSHMHDVEGEMALLASAMVALQQRMRALDVAAQAA